jgi:phosphatidate phosphatase APP1
MSDDDAPSWRERLGKLARDLRDDLEHAGQSIGLDVGAEKPYELTTYRGYGNERRVLVHGRALESPSLSLPSESDTHWRNLINTYKRVDADPLRGARVHCRIGGVEQELVADQEGFFRAWIDLPQALPSEEPWHEAELRLLAPLRPDQPDVRAKARIRLAGGAPSFGVISDLDDTVIQSRITSFIQAVRTVMLGNARTRLPFPGVAAFYQALEQGGDGQRRNPIFYVSSSPWNIHDVISDFMDIQRIPHGPIMLRDWDFALSALSSSRLKGHKEPLISEILDLYPTLPFILIGDDSQKDPEIYRAILDRYPGRILAIYIRNVRLDTERSESVKVLAGEVLASGSTLVVADDTYATAIHAAEQGWITTASLPGIKEEKKADEGTTGTKADVPGVPEEKPTQTVIVE